MASPGSILGNHLSSQPQPAHVNWEQTHQDVKDMNGAPDIPDEMLES